MDISDGLFLRANGLCCHPSFLLVVTVTIDSVKAKRLVKTQGRLHGAVGVTRVTRGSHTIEGLLLEAVDETMRQVFREAGAKVIYGYLENRCHLKREEIAEKTEVFSAGLERLLSSGAVVIEKLILKNLYLKLELKFEEKKGYEFSDYIKELRKKCGC